MTPLRGPAPTQAVYSMRLVALCRQGVVQVVRPASHSRRAEAARAWAKRMLLVSTATAVVIIGLMVWLDAREITWMPQRGTASLWPLRIMTDFGKSGYVISTLLLAMIGVTFLAPRIVGVAHATLVGFAARIQYILLAVVFANLIGEILKGVIGRGRPFVGGQANAFNFSYFAWSEAYASFPSAHATTAAALAFAVSAIWPRLRVAMVIYAVAILLSRLVLLAHHPSDVVGGALVGVTGAMVLRYWFAVRRVVFVIRADGGIVARHGAPAISVWGALLRAAKR